MKYFGCRVQYDGLIGHDARLMPAFSLYIVHNKHMICKIIAESKLFCIRLLFFCLGELNFD
ncbi:hypothetical protein D3C78_818840 [compost metagenome]